MLRLAQSDDLAALREIKDAAQDRLTRSGSGQVLGTIEDVDGYLLYSASAADCISPESPIQNVSPPIQRDLSSIQQGLSPVECGSYSTKSSTSPPTPIGICHLSPHPPAHIRPYLSTHPQTYLSSLIIHPAYQARGFGQQFIFEIQGLGKSMALDVWAGNKRLRRWYEELGWRFVAVVPEETYEVAVYVWP